jgi:hypothetical protein
MPFPHDHNEWVKAKAAKTAAYKKRKEEAKKSEGKANSAKKARHNGKALKLALGEKMTTALITQHHMTQTESETLFDSVYKKTMEEVQEN